MSYPPTSYEQKANREACRKVLEASEILATGGTVHNQPVVFYRLGCNRFTYPLFELLGYVYQIEWPDYHFMFIRVSSAVISDGRCTLVEHTRDYTYADVRFQETVDKLIGIIKGCPDRAAAFQRWEARECPVYFAFDDECLTKKEGCTCGRDQTGRRYNA